MGVEFAWVFAKKIMYEDAIKHNFKRLGKLSFTTTNYSIDAEKILYYERGEIEQTLDKQLVTRSDPRFKQTSKLSLLIYTKPIITYLSYFYFLLYQI